jgi:hypothetical protein
MEVRGVMAGRVDGGRVVLATPVITNEGAEIGQARVKGPFNDESPEAGLSPTWSEK